MSTSSSEQVQGGEGKFVWQRVKEISEDGTMLVLVSNSGKEYPVRVKAWLRRATPETVRRYLEEGHLVRVMYNHLTNEVRAVYHQKKIEKEIEEKERKSEEGLVINFGLRPLFEADRARMVIWKDGKGWRYKVYIWAPVVVDAEEYHKVRTYKEVVMASVVLKSKDVYYTRKKAIEMAVRETYEYIVNNVLGRDLTTFYPEEDEISLTGRRWLRNLEKVVQKYVGTKIVLSNAPAKIRTLNVKRLEGGLLYYTDTASAGFLTGVNILEHPKYRELLTGTVMDVSYVLEPNHPFLKIGKFVYNVYQLTAILESLNMERYLGTTGRILKDKVGARLTFTAYETKSGLLIIPAKDGYMLLSAVEGVEKRLWQEADLVYHRGELEVGVSN